METKESPHSSYAAYIKELRRLVALKYGEQLELDFSAPPPPTPKWRKKNASKSN